MTPERQLALAAATNEAIRSAMRRDEAVVCWGEDIKGGRGTSLPEGQDAWPKDMVTYAGLAAEFGVERVRDMPIAEAGFIGAAFGAASLGMRPIVDLMFGDFLGVCLDQLANQGAKNPYMTGGNLQSPVVVRTTFGAGRQMGAQHSSMHYSVFAHFPGLKVVAPSTPYDAKGLMTAAIEDESPVVFVDHRLLSNLKGPVPEDDYVVPIGSAVLRTGGDDVLLIAASRMVHLCIEAATSLREEGVQATVLDLRSISPLDERAIIDAAEGIGRVVVVDEDNPRCSISSDIVSLISRHAFGALEAPVEVVTPPHTPVPFSPPLEAAYLPTTERVLAAVHRAVQS